MVSNALFAGEKVFHFSGNHKHDCWHDRGYCVLLHFCYKNAEAHDCSANEYVDVIVKGSFYRSSQDGVTEVRLVRLHPLSRIVEISRLKGWSLVRNVECARRIGRSS